jgi:hypothetical protein
VVPSLQTFKSCSTSPTAFGSLQARHQAPKSSASVNGRARLFLAAQPWQAAVYGKASLLQQDLQVPPRRHSMPSAISAPRPSTMQILGCSAPRHQHGRHLAFQRQLFSSATCSRSFKRTKVGRLGKNRIL